MVLKIKNPLLEFKKIISYSVYGIINFCVCYGLFVIISNFIDYRITIVLTYIVGIFISYNLNRKFVFKVRGKWYLFIPIYVGTLLSNIAIITILVEEFNIIKEIAQLFTVSIVFFVRYIFLNRFAFYNNKK